jgi:hypothetical protein
MTMDYEKNGTYIVNSLFKLNGHDLMPMLPSFELRWKPKAVPRSELEHILAESMENYNAAFEERREASKLCRKQITYETNRLS